MTWPHANASCWNLWPHVNSRLSHWILFLSKFSFFSGDVMAFMLVLQLPSDARAPSNWVKVSSTKKTIRYHPPEVLTALDKLLLAKEELAVACRTTWDNFLMGFSKYYAQFRAAVQALAALDCLHSLAILSRNQVTASEVVLLPSASHSIHILCWHFITYSLCICRIMCSQFLLTAMNQVKFISLQVVTRWGKLNIIWYWRLFWSIKTMLDFLWLQTQTYFGWLQVALLPGHLCPAPKFGREFFVSHF